LLLVQQYYENPKFSKFLEDNFVLYRAPRGDKVGEEIFKKFKVEGTPFLLFLDRDGNEVDWIYRYSPPPEKFHEGVLKVLQGVDTFKSLSEQYAKEPKNVPVITKLARKYGDRFDEEKALALFKEVIAVDPQGKMGMTEYGKDQVSCTEFAEFSVSQAALYARGVKRNPEPLKVFVQKYPESKLLKTAYMNLASFYYLSPAKDEAFKFLEDLVAKYPENPWFRYYYVLRAIREKENIDRGLEMAEQIQSFDYARTAYNRAQLYSLKGDQSMIDAVYGKEFIENQVANWGYALMDYARFWMEKKMNMDSAEKMMETAVKLNPDNAYFRQTGAEICLENGKPEKAMEIFGPEFIKTNQDNAMNLMTYARFWTGKKQNTDSALSALEAALKLKPDDDYIVQSAASVLIRGEKPERALELFGTEFIKKHQDDAYTLSSYARFWATHKKNLDSALEMAKKAVEMNSVSIIWDSLAFVYLNMDRLEEALKAQQKALEIDEGYNTAHYQAQLKKIKDEMEKKKEKKSK